MHPTLQALIERRQNVWAEARGLLDHVETTGDGFSGEDDAKWDRLNADLEALDKRIREIQEAEARADEVDALADQYRGAPTPATDTDESILRSMIAGERVAHTFTPEARALQVGTNSEGGFTVPTGFYAQLQEHLIAGTAVRQAGATVITTDSGNDLEVPKTTTHPTASLIAEEGAVNDSDPVFAQTVLGAYKYGFKVLISAELEQDTGIDLVGYLAAAGGRALANGSGAHFVVGTGSGQPQGVIPAATVGKTGASAVAGAFTADDLIDLEYSVAAPYRRNAVWLMSDTAIAAARKLKGIDDQYLWQPSLQAGEPDRLSGYPIVSDPNVPTPAATVRSVAFGDFSRYFIRDVRGIRVDRSIHAAFGTDQVTWRFLFRTDGDLVDLTGAVKVFVGGAAS